MPRVVAGKAKRTYLTAPKGDKTRPTSDRAKEAIFSILMGQVKDTSFLDLYAGTGQMGIEALSRGAKEAVFVDFDKDAIKSINKNLRKTKFKDQAKVLKRTAYRAASALGEAGKQFDLIYFDPPYRYYFREIERFGAKLFKDLLTPGGILICEADVREIEASSKEEDLLLDEFNLVKRCKYGKAMVSFYKIK